MRAVLLGRGRKLCKRMLWVLEIDRGSTYSTKFINICGLLIQRKHI